MLPKFLQPEAVLFASLEVLRARLTDAQPPAPPRCAWCPGFVPVAGESHGICPTCAAQFDAAIEADRDAEARDEDRGSRCSAACGFCGACS
jgi:hypothetical protein